MKIKNILLAMATVAIGQNAFAQYSQDAIRFSGTQPGTTSRIKAIGNANIAVGGDLSAIGNNPAGLGFFTRSEASITPEFNQATTKSSYITTNTSDKRSDGNFNNASVVFYGKLNKQRGEDKTKGWLSVNFGAAYNRTNNFYQNTYYTGTNGSSSVADYYANLANQALDNGFSLDGYLEGWARDQRLIYLNNSNYYEPSTTLGGTQSNTITATGGQNEYNFSFGANYSNKLYIGAGFGITNIRYNYNSQFVEDNYEYVNVKKDFVSTYTRDQVTKGNGFNGRLGLIYKPVEAVRIGATVTTPTWYNIDDSSYEGLSTTFTGEQRRTAGSSYPASYNLRTPFKVGGGLAVFAGKYGFITGDVEFIDYSSTKLSSNDFDVSQDNADIKRLYRSAVNARFGAEARIPGNFFLRGGYGIQGNPIKSGVDPNRTGSDIKTISGGLGYRFGDYYIDATYVNMKRSDTQYPYELGELSPAAALKYNSNNVFLTLGVRF
jgi:hypothetical protein